MSQPATAAAPPLGGRGLGTGPFPDRTHGARTFAVRVVRASGPGSDRQAGLRSTWSDDTTE
jgi:hypothetical protein